MRITRADHLVLTVAEVASTVAWYEEVLGMRHVTFGGGRHALTFGQQKLNLHQAGREVEPKAARPTPGSVDLCLISADSLDEVQRHLRACGVPVACGPVSRTGATGPISSVYVRDPDGNLIEVSTYDAGRPRAPDPYDLLPAVPPFAVDSPDIGDGQPIKSRYTHSRVGGDNVSPALLWRGAPAATRGYAVTCFDPDAPTGTGFWHWLLLDLPASVRSLPAGAGRGGGSSLPPGAYQLRNDFGVFAYDGPAPLAAEPAHRYLFAVHALNTAALRSDPDSTAGSAALAITAHTIARAVLRATDKRP